MLRFSVFLAFLMPMVAMAQDAQHGRQLAQVMCTSCHKVGQTGSAARIGGVPTLLAIAENPETSPDSLRRYLSSTHASMPAFSTSEDRADMITYIMSLRK
ncbi:MAG: cytochrome c [Enhydrobacter sp.]